MKRNELRSRLPGKPTFVWMSGPNGRGAQAIRNGQEIVLRRDATILRAAVHTDTEVAWAPQPKERSDEGKLLALVGESQQPLAVVRDIKPGVGRVWLRVQVHPIDDEYVWDSIVIGVGDKVKNDIRSRGSIGANQPSRGDKKVLSELRELLVLPPAPGSDAPSRVVIVARPGQALHEPGPCRLLGNGVVADLRATDDGWRLDRITRHSGVAKDNERFVLVHVDVDFEDRSHEHQLRLQMRDELDDLVGGRAEASFLATWQRYRELENQHALRRLVSFHYLAYDSCEWVKGKNGVVRLRLNPQQARTEDGAAALGRLVDAVAANEEVELECAKKLPDVLGGSEGVVSDEPTGLLDIELEKGNDTGTVEDANDVELTIDLRVRPRRRDVEGVGPSLVPTLPEQPGFLHLAVGGDRAQLGRRQRALKRVLNEEIPLPQLLSLLQGRLARGRPREKWLDPLSDAALDCFPKRSPTSAQRAALDAALNTPDIAVIQGPPGTGKTRVIFALCARLAEEGDSVGLISRNILLTSFQHAAVDTLVNGPKNLGLPTIKIDRENRGSTAHVDAWQRDTINALRRTIPGSAGGRLALALRAVARHAAGYQLAPMPEPELVAVLGEVADLVRGLVADVLMARLDALRARLTTHRRLIETKTDSRRETVLRAVRGLRHHPESFGDDGPIMAGNALAQLERQVQVTPEHLGIIGRAADWNTGEVPPFLAELAEVRDQLIDQFGTPALIVDSPEPRPDVVRVLDEIVADLDDRQRSSPAGEDIALAEYLEDLEGDPLAVRSTLQLYTTALAATCQQADSPALRDAKDGGQRFDTVIVDEAARVNPLDLLIPLSNATSRIVLVGDQSQLAHMLDPDVESELGRGERADELTMLRQSLFAKLHDLLMTDTKSPVRAVSLNEQFRMHPVLGDFVSRNFYRGTVSSPLPPSGFDHDVRGFAGKPTAWLSVPNEAGGERRSQSKARRAEAQHIAALLKQVLFENPELSFGVISFYSAQVTLLWQELQKAHLAVKEGRRFRPVDTLRDKSSDTEEWRLRVGTVDAFQGKECDVVLLSTVRSSPLPNMDTAWLDPKHPDHPRYQRWARQTYGHIMIRNRQCVAMSRQHRLLIAVGDDRLFGSPLAPPEINPIKEFVRICATTPDGRLLSWHDWQRAAKQDGRAV